MPANAVAPEPSAVPVASIAPVASTDDRVRAVLDQIRPAVQADGGDVDFVDRVGSVVRVRFRGTCVGCPSLPLTLKGGVERAIRSQVPEVTRVESVG